MKDNIPLQLIPAAVVVGDVMAIPSEDAGDAVLVRGVLAVAGVAVAALHINTYIPILKPSLLFCRHLSFRTTCPVNRVQPAPSQSSVACSSYV